MERRAARLLLFAAVTVVVAPSCSSAPSEEEPVDRAEGAVTSCVAGARPSVGFGLEPAVFDLTFTRPVSMQSAPGDDETLYVVEKGGLVKRVSGAGAVSTFADLAARVNAQPSEAGLLGMAFHPKFAETGLVFFSYTKPSVTSPANLRSVIARAKSLDGGATIDPSSLVEVLTFDQPYANHNGGHIAFGPDGMLYAGFGDGGSAGDPQGNGQKKTTLLGKEDVPRARPRTPRVQRRLPGPRASRRRAPSAPPSESHGQLARRPHDRAHHHRPPHHRRLRARADDA